MSTALDSTGTPGLAASDDLSAVAWVAGELQRSLDTAHKALRRFLKEAQAAATSDVDAPDAAILRQARVQFHQSVGALELVGLPQPAKVLRASEAAVQRISGKPALLDGAAVDAIEGASFAVVDYLARLLARRPLSPVALFPQYRAVQTLAGVDRIHPADLWGAHWRWQPLPAEAGVAPKRADDQARGEMEALVLSLMRSGESAAKTVDVRLSDFCAQLAAGATSAMATTTWQLAAAFFDAQAHSLLQTDVYAKRMGSRLLAQLRANVRAGDEVSELLASDLLFFCARANAPRPGEAHRLAAVRSAWELGDTASFTDYETSRLGRFDPAWLAQARKRVVAAKDVWSAVAGGDIRRLANLAEPFALLGDSLQRLFPNGEVLATALQAAAGQTMVSGAAPGTGLAMEMATAVLWIDAALEEAALDSPELVDRVRHVAARIDQARDGGDVQPLEPWIEELYRRVSDQQTMGSVVQELRASLTEVEKAIDQFFRNPHQRDVLVPVPGQLQAMRGVLSVLDLKEASAAVVHMRNQVDELAGTEINPERALQTGTFDRLADNLGTIGFLIDMLSVQPTLARSLFHFDAEQGKLIADTGGAAQPSGFGGLGPPSPVSLQPQTGAGDGLPPTLTLTPEPLIDKAQSLAEQAVQPHVSDEDLTLKLAALGEHAVVEEQSSLARVAAEAQVALRGAEGEAEKQAARAEIAQAVQQWAQPHPEQAPPPAPPVVVTPPAPPGSTGLEDDDEMRGIFLEEAREVIATARASLQALTANSEDMAEMTTVRRAFHTLKGSSRMVGLREFGEAAWGCEQLYNARLASDPRVDLGLADFSRRALDELDAWVGDIEQRQDAQRSAKPLNAEADALRLGRAAPELSAKASTSAVPMAPELASAEPVLVDMPAPVTVPAPAAAAAVVASPPEPESHTVFEALVDGPDESRLGALDFNEPTLAIESTQVLGATDALSLDEPNAAVPSSAGSLELTFEAIPPTEVMRTRAQSHVSAGEHTQTLVRLPQVDATSTDFTLDLPLPSAPLQASASLSEMVPELPSAADLDLGLPPARQSDAPVELADAEQPLLIDFPEVVEVIDAQDGVAPLPLPEVTDELVMEPEGASNVGGHDAARDAGGGDTDLSSLVLDLSSLEDKPASGLAASASPVTHDASTLALLAPGGALPQDFNPDTLGVPFERTAVFRELAAEDAALTAEPAAGESVRIALADLPEGDDVPAAESTLVIDAGEATEASANEASLDSAADLAADEGVKVIGPLRIGIPLFNIFLNEADEQSRRLVTELAEWAHEWPSQPVPESSEALTHSLAGNSATVGYSDLSALARALEHAIGRSRMHAHGRAGEAELFADAAEEIRRLLHQFAAGFLKAVPAALMARLADHEHWPAPVEAADEAADEASPEVGSAVGDSAADGAAGEAAVEDEQTVHASLVGESDATVAGELAPMQALAASVAAADDIDAVDEIDAELLPIFVEEAEELLPQLQQRVAEWTQHPGNRAAADGAMRNLHTFKGGARLAGAMRVGELAHRLETDIEQLLARETIEAYELEPLQGQVDRIATTFEALRAGPAVQTEVMPQAAAPQPAVVAPEPAAEAAPDTAAPVVPAARGAAPAALAALAPDDVALAAAAAAAAATAALTLTSETTAPEAIADTDLAPLDAADQPAADQPAADQPAADTTAQASEPAAAEPAAAEVVAAPAAPVWVPIDWSRFMVATPEATQAVAAAAAGAAQPAPLAASGVVRVRSGLLDRLVNGSGEVSIARARIESDVVQLQGSLGELTGSLERMRRELRDIEVQAETQISARIEAAKAAAQAFDPLEMDRFTRLQELTRMMAESVNDVATLQRSLQRTLQSTEDQLAAQARLTRELQDDLLRTRMTEFESLADRLYRVVRQAARDTGKQVRLDIVGGAIEVDRGVLDRMAGPFEHLLRNSVAHGIESPDERAAAGKDRSGAIRVTVTQAGNEVVVEFADDGAGLNLPRIRERAIERGLLTADTNASEDELARLIFLPGFSTASTVTELAGRGVGMDVVRAEIAGMGGRIETHTTAGQGTRFRLVLPLTTAVTQVVMLRCGGTRAAVPSTLVEVVRRVPTKEVGECYRSGHMQHEGESVPFFWMASLIDGDAPAELAGRTQAVIVVRSASQRVALHIDEVEGNQEVVVKNLGPQLARMPGLAGVTLLPSGDVALIYNPVAMAALHGEAARERQTHDVSRLLGVVDITDALATIEQPAPAVAVAPLVMVVDDSLTVRRVTQRLLEREGYRVALAKDGIDALEKLDAERPAVMLCDIEMPRMDGFELVRSMRADPQRHGIPVVMITSRIAQKHRDHAVSLGVQHYLGKPFSEEQLLALVAQYCAASAALA